MRKLHLEYIIFFILFISFGFAIEGVDAKPDFLTTDFESSDDRITFPNDFEEVFHHPYRDYLGFVDSTNLLNLHLSATTETDVKTFGELNYQPFSLYVSAYRNKTDQFTGMGGLIKGDFVKLVWGDNPIDGHIKFGYDDKAFSVYKPKLTRGKANFRFTLPIDNDVVALNVGGQVLQYSNLLRNRQLGIEGKAIQQHHFGTYFGEEVILSGAYQVYQRDSEDFIAHRKFSFRAGFFLKRGVILGRIGLKSSGSHDLSITSPYIECQVDQHRFKAQVTYTDQILFPDFSTISGNLPEVNFNHELNDERQQSVKFYGALKIDDHNILSGSASYAKAKNHHYSSGPDTLDMLDIQTDDCELAEGSISYKADYSNFENTFTLVARRYRINDDGMFLPATPRYEVFDTLIFTISNTIQLQGVAGYSEGIYKTLNFPETNDPDIEESIYLTLGASYKIRDFRIVGRIENIAGETFDKQGFAYPRRLYFGITYEKL